MCDDHAEHTFFSGFQIYMIHVDDSTRTFYTKSVEKKSEVSADSGSNSEFVSVNEVKVTAAPRS